MASGPAGEEPAAWSAVAEAESRFDRWRRIVGVVLTPLAFLLAWLAGGERLSAEGRALAAVLAAAGVLWVTEVLPLPVTAMFAAVLCIVLGVADPKTVLAPFADPIVFLFIGSFILAQAMMLHRLDRRIALAFLSSRWIGGSLGRVFGGLGLITALLSMWVSNTATTAMMLPIALGVLQALHPAHNGSRGASLRDWPFATGMMLMIAYAASIGGIGTPVGSPPNLIAVGLIRSLAGVEISFFRWMSVAVPILLVMGLGLFLLLRFLHPAPAAAAGAAASLRDYLRHERRALGGWTRGQINTLVAFSGAVALWVVPGLLAIALPAEHAAVEFFRSRLTESVVALGAACLLFFLPIDLGRGEFTISWREASQIDWGTILLFGGGLSLGALMFETGLAKALGEAITAVAGAGSLWTLTAVSIGMAILLSETISNTAAATMIIPLVVALAQAGGVDPVPPALGACFGASFGFMLPVSTPPNAIVYGSGLIPIRGMMRAGILFDLVGLVLIFVMLRLLYPLLSLTG